MIARDTATGPLAWMARNGVAANLLMIVLVAGGIYMMLNHLRQEYLPSTEPDTVTVTVALPGATPAEVEQSIVLALEDALGAVQGIDKLSARASEGSAGLTLELGRERDRQIIYSDIQQAVDAVTGLPADAEEPVVKLRARQFSVMELILYGETTPLAMRMAAEHVRSALLQSAGISQVDIVDERDLELHVEVPEALLRAHRLTLGQIAATIRQSALDRAGGTIETRGGELLLRLADRREAIAEFAEIPLVTDPRGTVLRLGDIATISRGFETSTREITFNDRPAVQLRVYRSGDQTPLSVAAAVEESLPQAMASLPEAIRVEKTGDRSVNFRGRMDLLTTNGIIGLSLVLLLLTMFLNVRLAFWVAVGIPTAFMGAMLLLPFTGLTLNMVTMFAFIVALGLVVDDAIVVGENIYEYRQRGMDKMTASIQGARDIAVPLSFSILTNIAAFYPLLVAPGFLGKLFFVIPVVVSLAFLMSWVEALFVLPAHLSGGHGRLKTYPPVTWFVAALSFLEWLIGGVQWVFSGGLAWFIRRVYGPVLRLALIGRYVTVALMVAILLVAIAWVQSGRMGWGLFPPVPRDYAKMVVTLPVGAPIEEMRAAQEQVVAAAWRVIAENGGETLGRGVGAKIDGTTVDVRAYLTDPEVRPIDTGKFARLWRKEAGTIAAARSSRVESSWGGPGSTSLSIQLTHPDTDVLAEASARLADELGTYGPVRDPDDGFTPGKRQLEFRLTEAGRSLDLSSEAVADQVRAAFFGVTALTQQEGRNEVSVRVRLPEAERRSEESIETLPILTPDGGVVPLYEVAEITPGRADAQIVREDGQRIVSVTANVEPRSETNQVVAAVTADVLPQLIADYPGLSYSLSGRQKSQRDMMQSLAQNSLLALIVIYGLLAVPFRSYFQPMVIMMAIPFGFVGAVIGHEIMGYGLSVISVFGIIALSGVLINSGIVMMDYANRARKDGAAAFEAIWQAGLRRFRPILLTTVTTFCGLAPMIFETSRQAQFLIPMAISLGYGIVFATLIVLFMIPALYLILEDLIGLVNPETKMRRKGADLPVPAE